MMLPDVCLSDVCLSVAFIGPKSRVERLRKTKIGTEVAHVTHDSDTAFKVKMLKVNLQGVGVYCGGLPCSWFYIAAKGWIYTFRYNKIMQLNDL